MVSRETTAVGTRFHKPLGDAAASGGLRANKKSDGAFEAIVGGSADGSNPESLARARLLVPFGGPPERSRPAEMAESHGETRQPAGAP